MSKSSLFGQQFGESWIVDDHFSNKASNSLRILIIRPERANHHPIFLHSVLREPHARSLNYPRSPHIFLLSQTHQTSVFFLGSNLFLPLFSQSPPPFILALSASSRPFSSQMDAPPPLHRRGQEWVLSLETLEEVTKLALVIRIGDLHSLSR